MGSDELISAMDAATHRLNMEQMTQPHTTAMGPPLLKPTEKEAVMLVRTPIAEKPIEALVRRLKCRCSSCL